MQNKNVSNEHLWTLSNISIRHNKHMSHVIHQDCISGIEIWEPDPMSYRHSYRTWPRTQQLWNEMSSRDCISPRAEVQATWHLAMREFQQRTNATHALMYCTRNVLPLLFVILFLYYNMNRYEVFYIMVTIYKLSAIYALPWVKNMYLDMTWKLLRIGAKTWCILVC
jgi:hypothetical protein